VKQPIPDNSALGLTLATNLTFTGGSISSLTVGLDITGGFNGDLAVFYANYANFPEFPFSLIRGNSRNSRLLSGLPMQNATFSSFMGTNPDETCALFLADLSSGGQSTVVNWSLDVTTVPELPELTLAGLGLAALRRVAYGAERALLTTGRRSKKQNNLQPTV